MKLVFVELPAFARHRADYLDDDGLRALQNLLLKKPDAGVLMPDTVGLRKLRFADAAEKANAAARGSSTTGGMPGRNAGCSRSTTKTNWWTSRRNNVKYSE